MMHHFVERHDLIYPADPEDPRRRSSTPMSTMEIVDKLNELAKFEQRAKLAAHALVHPINADSIKDTLWMPDGPETIFDALGGDIDEAMAPDIVRPMGVFHQMVEQSLRANLSMAAVRDRLKAAGFVEVTPGEFMQQDPSEEDRHG